MASSTRSIDVLLRQLPDPQLRGQLQAAVDALRQHTSFGLVFEGHHPEVSRLPGYPVVTNSLVARRTDRGNRLLRVASISNGVANCYDGTDEGVDDQQTEPIPVSDLVVCKRFGDAIYPSLHLIEAVQKTHEKPWHLLLEADNHHALQLLRYTHASAIDVIYIDPPYNTGAKDWKYNNAYVDGTDPWRHSKWLSFMEKRLRLAAALLKPDGVLVVTIDEHEVHHLGCLLEQTFTDCYQQMVTIVINPAGVTQGRFSRVEEHAIFCFRGNSKVVPGEDDFLSPVADTAPVASKPQWESLLRRGTGAKRSDRKSMFYPVVIDPDRQAVLDVGEPLPFDEEPDFELKIGGFPVAWPVRTDLSLGRWKVGAETLKSLIELGYVKLGRYDHKRKTWGITYVTRKIRQQISSGEVIIQSYDEVSGAAQLAYANERTRPPRTVWNRNLYNAGPHGTDFLRLVFGEGDKFPFPKSVYAVRDTLAVLLRDKKDAVVLDFFGGSGTTHNAVCLLNLLDGGTRRSITVTNNEVSDGESKSLSEAGLQPGDADWERHGICQAVTWPRMKYVTNGQRADGQALPGEYFTGQYIEKEVPPKIFQVALDGRTLSQKQRKDIVRLMEKLPMSAVKAKSAYSLEANRPVTVLWDTDHAEEWLTALEEAEAITDVYIFTSDNGEFQKLATLAGDQLPVQIDAEAEKRPLSDGFEENTAYLRLGFLDVDTVAKGQAFAQLLPVLWLASGAKAACPTPQDAEHWLISRENDLAVLLVERHFQAFLREIGDLAIRNVFLVTDALDAFQEMNAQLPPGSHGTMLYASLLRNFQLNSVSVSP